MVATKKVIIAMSEVGLKYMNTIATFSNYCNIVLLILMVNREDKTRLLAKHTTKVYLVYSGKGLYFFRSKVQSQLVATFYSFFF